MRLVWMCLLPLGLVTSYTWTYSDWKSNVPKKLLEARYMKKEKCEKKQVFGTHGNINSPNYPSRYPNNVDCSWIIETPEEYTELHIELSYFNVEYDYWTSMCFNDFLEFYQYPDSKKQRKATYCGKRSGQKLVLYGNKFKLRFKTNGFRKRKGFHITWKAVKGCGGLLTGSRGIIKLKPSNLTDKYFFCEWKIENKKREMLQINIKKLQIKNDGDICSNNNVKIFGSKNEIITQYCHNINTPKSIRTNHKDIRIRIKLKQRTDFNELKATWMKISNESSEVKKIISTCGTTHNHHRMRRLVAGQSAFEGEWPWMIQLRITVISKYYTTRTITCGGIIISSSFILTAAHCVKRKEQVLQYEVLLGVVEESSNTIERQIIKSNQIFIHPKFEIKSSGIPINDIAVLKLANKLRFNERIQPICLPPKGHKEVEQKNCEFAGWGKTHENSLHSRNLNKIKASLWGHCQTTETIICATYNGKNAGVCKGDSGSPLICPQKDGRKYLVGILSYGGLKCPSKISGHINVAFYMDWIESVTTSNSITTQND